MSARKSILPAWSDRSRRILDAISPDADAGHGGVDDDEYFDPSEAAPIIISANGHGHGAAAAARESSGAQFERYSRALSPLFAVETRLLQQLSDPEDNVDKEATHLPGQGSAPLALPAMQHHERQLQQQQQQHQQRNGTAYPPQHANGADALPRIVIPAGSRSLPNSPVSGAEPTVRTTSNWKKAFALGKIQSPKSVHSGELQGWWEDPDDPVHAINHCAPYISQLWRDGTVRQRLQEKRIRLEESSGL